MTLSEFERTIVDNIADGRYSTLHAFIIDRTVDHELWTYVDVPRAKHGTVEPFDDMRPGDRYAFNVPMDRDIYNEVLNFRAVVELLHKHDLVLVLPGAYRTSIATHQHSDIDPEMLTIVRAVQQLRNLVSAQSTSLQITGRAFGDERYVPLPSIRAFIDNGYRTADEIEFAAYREHSEAARRDAEAAISETRRANATSRRLTIIVIATSVISLVIQGFVACSTTDVEIVNLPRLQSRTTR